MTRQSRRPSFGRDEGIAPGSAPNPRGNAFRGGAPFFPRSAPSCCQRSSLERLLPAIRGPNPSPDIDVSWRYNSINDHRPTLSGTQAHNSVGYASVDGGIEGVSPRHGRKEGAG